MSLTLIAAVIALVLGHVAPSLAAGVRDFSWYQRWLLWLDARFPTGFWRGRQGLVLALLPPLLVVGLFQLALAKPLLGLAGLVFGIAAVFYSWGPRDLDLDVEAIMAAADPAARVQAAARLGAASMNPASLVEAVFNTALRRWFGVLFWFLLLGPVGALLYRLSALSAEGDAADLPAETRAGAKAWLALLDWPVAQLMTLALALVGDFDTVVGAWKDNRGASFHFDANFLAAAARASVRTELADEAMDYADHGVVASGVLVTAMGELPELRDAMSLVWRILLLWLAVLALFVVAGWVG
ncbi:MAG: transrane protein [Xanthomonadaceae bacterium]|nr:transrane protein [Xanthomonadaceae bacterium]